MIATLKDMIGRPVAFYVSLANITGSAPAGLMLSQALYWTERTTDPEGWFWKTREGWQRELGLTRCEQETARHLLRESGIWQERRAGLPARMHYRLDLAALDSLLSKSAGKPQTGSEQSGPERTPPTGLPKTVAMAGGNPPSRAGENPPAFLPETTAETPPERNQHACSAAMKAWLKAWVGIKEELQAHLPAAERKLWLRPAMLLKVLSGNVLLIALPPNGRIIEAAGARKPLIAALAVKRGFQGVSFTRYPDDHDRKRLAEENPEFYAQMFGNGRSRGREGAAVTATANHS